MISYSGVLFVLVGIDFDFGEGLEICCWVEW